MDRPPGTCGLSTWKQIFLKNLCQKPQILNNSQKPTDCPPREPGLSAQHLKLVFLNIFNEILLPREIVTHLNAMHANS
jgi:hypothetical protein